MRALRAAQAVAAATATARALGREADSAVVLQESNSVTLRLLPCDIVARVRQGKAHIPQAARELDLARALVELGAPAAGPDPALGARVHERDGFVVTFWTYFEPVGAHEIPPVLYAQALERLHAGMRVLDAPVPHFMDRVASAQRLIDSPARTPDLAGADRELLSRTLRSASRAITDSGATEQLLHGEPQPGNLLSTKQGLLFVDWETSCRGPIEFDVAHAPPEVATHYRRVDPDLLIECRLLVLAMITTWRWDRNDRLPEGRVLGRQWLDDLRAMVERSGRAPS